MSEPGLGRVQTSVGSRAGFRVERLNTGRRTVGNGHVWDGGLDGGAASGCHCCSGEGVSESSSVSSGTEREQEHRHRAAEHLPVSERSAVSTSEYPTCLGDCTGREGDGTGSSSAGRQEACHIHIRT